ncbi:MAG: phage replisome organizer N-terminal domain-containing protein [Erysipelotrichaceae bacterium]|nr:phage replisome organizer N-terminal domain-containing protein [Erysipelotrichaceae bacterium]
MEDNALLQRRNELKEKEIEAEAIGRNSKRYYWMKLKNTFFTQPAIKRLRKIPGGDTYTIIYLKMMLHTIESEGIFVFEGIETSFEKEVALILDEEEDAVQITIDYLRSKMLIEEGHGDYGMDYLMTEVPELIDSETVAAKRKRIRQQRERERLAINQGKTGDGELSSPKFQEIPQSSFSLTDKELEQEQEKKRDKDSDSEQDQNLIKQTGKYSTESETYDIYEARILSTMTDEQYSAWKDLLKKMQLGELKTTRGNLTRYFEQMQKRNWNDYSGNPIRNIISYVEMNFAANARERDIAKEKLAEEGFEPGSVFVPYRKH